ncbi:NADH-quinone oxidoreductase subunit C [Egicoccus sp. AB-alg2]|uniref:NADH-quinone oxidoreductase subunit C n=1 Tax=Egicoccus sp. AB-alg2 TaxID=3242693 RepID=UPI00359D6D85
MSGSTAYDPDGMPGPEMTGRLGTTLPAPGHGTAGASLTNDQLRERVLARFPGLRVDEHRGELTIFVEPDQLVEVMTFCRDDEELACELLSDLSGVHWPAGDHVIERQISTTGWPEYRVSREQGVIEVDYVLRSVRRNHWLRLSVGTPDDAARLPSVTSIYPTANFHEREVYDMFGVEFTGHPNLIRILMPDDWLGHPQRKDYPLGGVEIDYENDKFIPPPHERNLREVVE